ncbi:MAG: DNA starvation/stationary phase protection protein [Archangium sp.]
MKTPDLGLTERERVSSAAELNVVLSNLFVLHTKTKKLEWDIVGPQFGPLGEMLGDQARDLTNALDAVAERVRVLGAYPLGTARGFLELATLREHPGRVLGATASLMTLVEDHEVLVRGVRDAITRLSGTDFGTRDFLIGLLRTLETSAYQLRSWVEGESLHPDGAVRVPAAAMPSLA